MINHEYIFFEDKDGVLFICYYPDLSIVTKSLESLGHKILGTYGREQISNVLKQSSLFCCDDKDNVK